MRKWSIEFEAPDVTAIVVFDYVYHLQITKKVVLKEIGDDEK